LSEPISINDLCGPDRPFPRLIIDPRDASRNNDAATRELRSGKAPELWRHPAGPGRAIRPPRGYFDVILAPEIARWTMSDGAVSENSRKTIVIRRVRRHRDSGQPGVFLWPVAALLCAGFAGGNALAQDLTPRTYWPAPKGTQLFIFGYANQTGDVVTDPSLPIAGVDSRIDSGVLAYQQTLDLFGRTGNVQIAVPYVDGTTTGMVADEPGRRDVAGLGDVSMTFTVNLRGAPTMSAAEFQALRQAPRPILGASIKIVAPTGEYDADRLINIGTNRWAARLQLGYVRPLSRKWLLEVSAGAWFFEDNDEFLGGTREQDPIGALNAHLVHRFSPASGPPWTSITTWAATRPSTANAMPTCKETQGWGLALPFRSSAGTRSSSASAKASLPNPVATSVPSTSTMFT
jgi:hypothetical protein